MRSINKRNNRGNPSLSASAALPAISVQPLQPPGRLASFFSFLGSFNQPSRVCLKRCVCPPVGRPDPPSKACLRDLLWCFCSSATCRARRRAALGDGRRRSVTFGDAWRGRLFRLVRLSLSCALQGRPGLARSISNTSLRFPTLQKWRVEVSFPCVGPFVTQAERRETQGTWPNLTWVNLNFWSTRSDQNHSKVLEEKSGLKLYALSFHS